MTPQSTVSYKHVIKLRASEFSAKVKASNLIEENILKQKLNSYNRQVQTFSQMIDRESKRFQEELQGNKKLIARQKHQKMDYTEEEKIDFDQEKISKAPKKIHHRFDRKKTRKKRLPSLLHASDCSDGDLKTHDNNRINDYYNGNIFKDLRDHKGSHGRTIHALPILNSESQVDEERKTQFLPKLTLTHRKENSRKVASHVTSVTLPPIQSNAPNFLSSHKSDDNSDD